MATEAEAFEIPVAILTGDVDDAGHVNNIVYVRWIQEAAIAHWTAVAPADVQRAVRWVVLRHEIDYRRAALPGDTVRARTWVTLADAVRVERRTSVVRESDGAVLANARTLWCPIGSATGRPLRVSDDLRVLFSVPKPDGRTLKA
jgi:acyl-CoA thioester hydrolase